jgi:hypothetical protein
MARWNAQHAIPFITQEIPERNFFGYLTVNQHSVSAAICSAEMQVISVSETGIGMEKETREPLAKVVKEGNIYKANQLSIC